MLFKRWYTIAKQRQKPVFSEIYAYAITKINALSYSYPIYVNDANSNIFYGVLAVDLKMDEISKFLRNITRNTNYMTMACEDKWPHAIAGISTGTPLSKSCSGDQTDNNGCMVLPVNVKDLINSGAQDMLLRKAHELLDINGYVPNQIVTFLEKDGQLNSLLYIARSQIYEQPDRNLRWRIVTVWPLLETGRGTITIDESYYWIIVGNAFAGFTINLTLFVLFYQKRKETAVQLSDFQLTSAFLIGCAMINLSALTYLHKRTDVLCNVSLWIYNMLEYSTLSFLIVKMYRLHKLVGVHNTAYGERQMTNSKAWLYVLLIPMIELIILTIFTIVDPLKAMSIHTAELDVSTVECKRNIQLLFPIVQLIYFMIVIGTACFLLHLVRKVDSKFGDGKALLFVVYNIAFIGVIFYTIMFSVRGMSQQNKSIITAICTLVVTVFASAAIVVPRLRKANKSRELRSESMHDLRTGSYLAYGRNMRPYASDVSTNVIHKNEKTFKILICSSNMGNTAPTLSSMKAWIPEDGQCTSIESLDEETIKGKKFQLIVIGMQEASWSAQKEATVEKTKEQFNEDEKGTGNETDLLTREKTHRYLASVEGEDNIALRNMEEKLLGPNYISIARKTRGQMRLHIYAHDRVAPFIEEISSSRTNTGIGNLYHNKGGIVISLEYQKTRFTFLSAHLAAHEGETYYQSRCNNMRDILRFSQTFELSKIMGVAVSS